MLVELTGGKRNIILSIQTLLLISVYYYLFNIIAAKSCFG